MIALQANFVLAPYSLSSDNVACLDLTLDTLLAPLPQGERGWGEREKPQLSSSPLPGSTNQAGASSSSSMMADIERELDTPAPCP